MYSFRKNLLISCAILSSVVLNCSNPGYIHNRQTIYNNISTPKETIQITRYTTPSEIALAEKDAASSLQNYNKSLPRILVENISFALNDTINLAKEYTWDAQPLGIKHGGKAIVLIATCSLLYYVYCKNNKGSDGQTYIDTMAHKS